EETGFVAVAPAGVRQAAQSVAREGREIACDLEHGLVPVTGPEPAPRHIRARGLARGERMDAQAVPRLRTRLRVVEQPLPQCAPESSPFHSAGSEQVRPGGTASAPRISSTFLSRTSGKTVVRWRSQSASVARSPSRPDARKRRNVIPLRGRYSPPRTRKNIGTSSAHSTYRR